MQIDDRLVCYLEELSSLALTNDEKLRLTVDLRGILDEMAQLSGLNTENIPERSHPFDNVNAFRDDRAAASIARELMLKNAPVRSGDMLIAPKTVE